MHLKSRHKFDNFFAIYIFSLKYAYVAFNKFSEEYIYAAFYDHMLQKLFVKGRTQFLRLM